MKITDKIIRNIEFPSCKNCKYYRPSVWNNDFTSPLNKCGKVGVKDIITDKITFEYVDNCRFDDNLCGKKGKYYEKEQRLLLKKLKHRVFCVNNLVYLIPTLYLLAYAIKFFL